MALKVLVVGHEDAKKLLPMDQCITVMERMFRTLAAGDAILPLRQAVWLPDRNGALGVMPAYLGDPKVVGGKIITFFHDNRAPFESHQGTVLLFDTENGRLLAIVDATTVTSIRTAAASAVATKLLAREEAKDLAILGSGTQASMHLDSMSRVRKIGRVRVWSRRYERAKAFAESASSRMKPTAEAFATVKEAVSGADIICTATSATAPILEGRWLSPGCHVNAIGASVPPFRELDTEAVVKSKLYTDRRESLFNEADDFRIPKKEGAIDDSHLVGEIGEVLIGKVHGRTSSDEITLFKSLGLAVEDLAAAHHIYSEAQKSGSGTWVEFTAERRD